MLNLKNSSTGKDVASIYLVGVTEMNPDEIARLLLSLKHSPLAQNTVVKFTGHDAVRADMLLGGALPSVTGGAWNVHTFHVSWPPTLEQIERKDKNHGTL